MHLFLALSCQVTTAVSTTTEAPDATAAAPETQVQAPPPAEPSEGDLLLSDLRSKPLTYTRHAECRMGCRQVSEAEVQELLTVGVWVPERSRDDGECPSHAVEGTSSEGQSLRIVYAACDTETKVVTTIDLNQDWPCDCE